RGNEKQAPNVRREGMVPLGDREILERLGDGDTGVVHEQVDRAEPLGDALVHPTDVPLVADVGRKPRGANAGGVELRLEQLELALGPGGYTHRVPRSTERERDGSTDSFGGAGDERDFGHDAIWRRHQDLATEMDARRPGFGSYRRERIPRMGADSADRSEAIQPSSSS